MAICASSIDATELGLQPTGMLPNFLTHDVIGGYTKPYPYQLIFGCTGNRCFQYVSFYSFSCQRPQLPFAYAF